MAKSESLTLVYGWSPNQWLRAPMKASGGRFSVEVKAWLDVPYLWCWVEDPASGVRDTNHGAVWDTYLFDEHEMPVKEAGERRAEMYLIRGEPAEKNDVAIGLLDEELRACCSTWREMWPIWRRCLR